MPNYCKTAMRQLPSRMHQRGSFCRLEMVANWTCHIQLSVIYAIRWYKSANPGTTILARK